MSEIEVEKINIDQQYSKAYLEDLFQAVCNNINELDKWQQNVIQNECGSNKDWDEIKNNFSILGTNILSYISRLSEAKKFYNIKEQDQMYITLLLQNIARDLQEIDNKQTRMSSGLLGIKDNCKIYWRRIFKNIRQVRTNLCHYRNMLHIRNVQLSKQWFSDTSTDFLNKIGIKDEIQENRRNQLAQLFLNRRNKPIQIPTVPFYNETITEETTYPMTASMSIMPPVEESRSYDWSQEDTGESYNPFKLWFGW